MVFSSSLHMLCLVHFRLTPLYAMILFFVAALAGRLGSGPNWNTVQYQSEDCRAYWWSHLLYINNIFPSDLTFVSHTQFAHFKQDYNLNNLNL